MMVSSHLLPSCHAASCSKTQSFATFRSTRSWFLNLCGSVWSLERHVPL